MDRPLPRIAAEDGIALPIALLGVILLGVLTAGIWMTVNVNARSGGNWEQAVRARQMAEGGVAHAVGILAGPLETTSYDELLRGPDGEPGTDDDGRVTGRGLSSDEEIPEGGRNLGSGSYAVLVVDDPADGDGDPLTDSNGRVLVRSTGTTPRGGSAVVEAVVGGGPTPAGAGVRVDGDLRISGTPDLVGSCGGAHANGDLSSEGNVTVSTRVSATGTISVSGSISDPDGEPVEPLAGVASVEIPDHDPMSFCGSADYVLGSDGVVTETATGSSFDADGGRSFGWSWDEGSPGLWSNTGQDAVAGTFCVQGDARVSGNVGRNATLPFTVIARGSIDVSGTPDIEADHPDGILLMAGADLDISGNARGGYDGSIYARNQCRVTGNPRLWATLECKDLPTGSDARDLLDSSSIEGNAVITSRCDATSSSSAGPRRVLTWMQRLGG